MLSGRCAIQRIPASHTVSTLWLRGLRTIKGPAPSTDNISMNNASSSLHRLTTTSHFLTVLILTAIGAVILIPFSPQHGHLVSQPSSVQARSTHSGTTSVRPSFPTTTTSTTAAPAAVPTSTTPSPPTTTPVAPRSPAVVAAAAVPSGYGCGPAIAYLRAYAAPGFTLECPGWADGHQAMSCDNVPGVCPGTLVIAISTPCPAAYMNEASNSWVILGEKSAPLDPYGYCQ
jgi:hypothetical protein